MDSDQQNPLVSSRNLQIMYPLVPTCWLLLNLSCEFCHLQEEMTVLLPHWVVKCLHPSREETNRFASAFWPPLSGPFSFLLSPIALGKRKPQRRRPSPTLQDREKDSWAGVGRGFMRATALSKPDGRSTHAPLDPGGIKDPCLQRLHCSHKGGKNESTNSRHERQLRLSLPAMGRGTRGKCSSWQRPSPGFEAQLCHSRVWMSAGHFAS